METSAVHIGEICLVICIGYVLVLLMVGVHERGHIIGLTSCGFMWEDCCVGPLLWQQRRGRVTQSYSGIICRGFVSPESKFYQASLNQRLVFLLGGAVANALFGLLLSSTIDRYPALEHYDANLFMFLALISMGAAICKLIPFRIGDLRSDGLQIYELLSRRGQRRN